MAANFEMGQDPEARAQRTYLAVWAANFLAAIGMMSFIPFFPSYLAHLGVEPELVPLWAGILVGAAPLAAAFMGPVWGALGDRYGRKPMVLRALVGIVLFVSLMSLARTPLQLLFLRLGQGVFSGFLPPSVTLVTMSFPSGHQGRIAGGLQAAMAGGTIVGPLFGSFFRANYAPHLLFLATASLALVAALSVAILTREPKEGEAAASGRALEQRDHASNQPGGLAVLVDVFRRLGSMLRKPRIRTKSDTYRLGPQATESMHPLTSPGQDKTKKRTPVQTPRASSSSLGRRPPPEFPRIPMAGYYIVDGEQRPMVCDKVGQRSLSFVVARPADLESGLSLVIGVPGDPVIHHFVRIEARIDGLYNAGAPDRWRIHVELERTAAPGKNDSAYHRLVQHWALKAPR